MLWTVEQPLIRFRHPAVMMHFEGSRIPQILQSLLLGIDRGKPLEDETVKITRLIR